MLVLSALVACAPSFPRQPENVDTPRIIHISSQPPEAAPGEAVVFTVVRTEAAPPVSASWCRVPTAPTDPDSVSADCIAKPGTPVSVMAERVMATLPSDACRVFGPLPPPGGARPHDPDPTGGYYVPLRVTSGELLAFGFQRLRCELANAQLELAIEFRERYPVNRNPTLLRVTARVDEAEIDLSTLPAGRPVQLNASWTPESVEPFVRFDIATQSLVEVTETLTLSWFVSGGVMTSTGTWQVDEPGTYRAWTVLRDNRGGSAVLETALVAQ
ncbi:MAG: hypothetical protein ACT4TC_11930 [Myxococcaceae bacterium]